MNITSKDIAVYGVAVGVSDLDTRPLPPGAGVGFVLPLPPSANRYWRHCRGMTFLSAEAKAYKLLVAATLARGRVQPFVGEVAVKVAVFRKIKSGDLDNFLKVLFDSLRGIVYSDDNQIIRIEATRHDDKNNPRVEVSVGLCTGAQVGLFAGGASR